MAQTEEEDNNMATGYTRATAAIATGNVIEAAHLNDEYNAVQAAYHATTGHNHDGTTGGGTKIPMASGVSGTLPVANGGTAATSASAARTALGVAIGSNVQAYTSVLGATTASFLTAQNTKVNFITVTQAVDLDTMESNIATNNGKATNVTQTITLTGDVTGGGTGTFAATVVDDSHTHTVATITNLSGTNTGDNATNSQYSSLATNVSTNLGYTAAVSNGSLTSSDGTNATIPGATTTAAGLLSKADKLNLDSLVSSGGVTNLAYTASTRVLASSSGTDVTLPVVIAAGTSGLMTGADKTKIDSVATGADVTASGNSATSTLATGVIVTNSTSAQDYPIVWHDNSNALKDTVATFTFNPSTGNLKAPNLVGNGASLTALNGSNISTGTIAAARVATLNQSTTGSAATLTTPRTISGVNFDGSAPITLNNNAITNGASYITNAALGTLGPLDTINNAHWSGTDLSVANGGTGSGTASGARTNLGLGSLAVLSTVNNGNWSGTDLALANGGTGASDAGGARTALGLGALAVLGTVNNSNWSGTDLAVANGGTGASDAGAARTALGVGSMGTDAKTVSTSAASGTPADGDVWFRYTA